MDKEQYVDLFLEKRIVKYDEWLRKGEISYSSKIIPVAESFTAKQWVLPSEQVQNILGNAKSMAVQNCECRTHYKRCDNPLEVCFLLDNVGDAFVQKGMARSVDLVEATEILKKANESGLVHLGLYMPDHQLYAVCSCCPCCCHELQIVKLYERRELIIHSEYVAVTRGDDCIHCGECVDRCVFGARSFHEDKMEYTPSSCVGCGLCITQCPSDAIFMKLRNVL
jgi:ferredoxin